jgi:hypothetical protein
MDPHIPPDHRVRAYFVSHGAPIPPQDEYKRAVIQAFAAWSGAKVFIETGTYRGDTTEAMRPFFPRIFTIEAKDTLFADARLRFAPYPSVRVLYGDSAVVLPQVLRELNEPAVFWLDAHWCGETTFGEYLSAAVMPELEAVFAHPIKSHIILIDDARYFCGQYGYPSIDHLRRWVIARRAELTFDVALDSIRIYDPAAPGA